MNKYQQGREIDFQYERDLANLLATIIRREFEIEKLRSLLCENDKFEVTESFRSLDTHGHGYLTSNDLKLFLSQITKFKCFTILQNIILIDYLKKMEIKLLKIVNSQLFIINRKNHIMTREKECDFLCYVYAKNHSTISFMEFINIVLPKQDDDLKEQCLARRKFRPATQKPQLAFYLEEQLSKIFELEIAYIRETEAQKMDIMNNYGWNYRESFKRIARPGQNFIDKQAFYAFMIQNQYTEFNENSFKYILIRFNKDDNDLITMDEFCHAIFPSDFLSDNRNQNEKIQNPYFRYVKGDEQEFIEYVTGTNRAYEDVDKFDQQDFVFQNDIDNYNSQQKRQGIEQPKKFLKTSVQYDNTSNIRPFSGTEYINPKDDYPTLNKYLMKLGEHKDLPDARNRYNYSQSGQKFFSPQQYPYKQQPNQVEPERHFQSQGGFNQSQKSPINILSSQKKLYVNYDNFRNQNEGYPNDYAHNYQKANPRKQSNNENEQFQTFNENQSGLANSFFVKSQLNQENQFRNTQPPGTRPIGINASTQKFF